MFNKVIKSILEKLKIIEQVIIITIKKEFIFVNIGMIAISTNPKKIKVGEIYNPIITYQIKDFDEEKQKFKINLKR